MQDIRQCCQDLSRRRFSVFGLRNEIQELQEWKNDSAGRWTHAEKKCIQSFIDDKTSLLEYQVKKIKEDRICCSIVSKLFLETTAEPPVVPTTEKEKQEKNELPVA